MRHHSRALHWPQTGRTTLSSLGTQHTARIWVLVLGPSWLQLAAAAWQQQPYELEEGLVGNVQGSWGAAGGLGAQGYQNLLSTEHQSIQQNICGAMNNPVLDI